MLHGGLLKSLNRGLGFGLGLVALSACLNSQNLINGGDAVQSSNYEGCLTAEALDTSSVRVSFEFPKEASSVKIYRDGIAVFQVRSSAPTTQFIDRNLSEGSEYGYLCEITVGETAYEGSRKLTVETPSLNAPNFNGIATTQALSSSSVKVSWGLTSGVAVNKFKVYRKLSADTNSIFSYAPVAELSAGSRETTITGLGDDLEYVFAVRACSRGDVCDSNTATSNVTTPNSGAPKTSGASAAQLVEGSVRLTALWTHSDGAVAVRRIYRHTAASLAAACSTNIADYSALNEVAVTNVSNPPTLLTALGTLSEGTKYCYIVRDLDAAGNESTNTNVVTVAVGDLTKPNFTSSLTLTRDPSNPDTKLVASWTAMIRDSDNALQGAAGYKLYLSGVSHGNTPSINPCTDGVQVGGLIPAAPYAAGITITQTLQGLNPRWSYRACVMAVDSSNNISDNKPTAIAVTGDITAPVFFGIQSLAYNAGTSSLNVGITHSSSTDLQHYKVRIVRTRSSVTSAPQEITKTLSAAGGSSQLLSVSLTEASLQDNDLVAVRVNACDNAAPTFASSDNCTSTTGEITLSIPDATPPANFAGISTATPGSTNGQISISWIAPASWTDYYGFKIYSVESGALVHRKSCFCASTNGTPDCSTPANRILSCSFDSDVNGQALDKRRTYEWYVRALDSTGNETTYLPFTGGTKVTTLGQTKDIQAPVFTASATATYGSSKVSVSFNRASDDQYTSSPDNGLINYTIYRKRNAAFVCPLSPATNAGGCDNLTSNATTATQDGIIFNGAETHPSISLTGARLTFEDTLLADGQSYHYQICARDSSNNIQCQTGGVPTATVPDVTPPVFINPHSYRTITDIVGGLKEQNWGIYCDATDNQTSGANLFYEIRRSTSGFPAHTDTGSLVYSGTGSCGVSTNDNSGAQTFFYTVSVRDEAGNRTHAQFKDMPEPPTLDVNAVTPNASTIYLDGGESVTIAGSGFLSVRNARDLEVHIGDALCTSPVLVNNTTITCNTPKVREPGGKKLRVILRDGRSIASTSAVYTYHPWCHASNSQNDVATGFQRPDDADINGLGSGGIYRGDGSSSKPYRICTFAQFINIRNYQNPTTPGIAKKFILMDDINFQGQS